MQKMFPFLIVVDITESEMLCSLFDRKFNVADGGRTKINQPRNTTKIQ